MKLRLLEWLACPDCAGPFRVTTFVADGGEIAEGLLTCGCGRVYPIVDTIPRILDDAFVLFPEMARRGGDAASAMARGAGAAHATLHPAVRRTRDSFGYQWMFFSQMVVDFRENFLTYIHPIDESFFPNKLGVDVGCGFGRHIYNAALFGAEMIGVDISAAIDATRHNTRHLPNVHLVQANIYQLPFRPGTFDFAYSIGVLHHLPDPEAGFRRVVSLVKPGGAVFIWVYSTSRRFVNVMLECVRALTTRLPRRLQRWVSLWAAIIDWGIFILPCRVALKIPGVGAAAERLALPRLKVYAKYPFQVCWADWFDRLAAPIRFYYDAHALSDWLAAAGLQQPRISPTGLFGWRAYGERPASAAVEHEAAPPPVPVSAQRTV